MRRGIYHILYIIKLYFRVQQLNTSQTYPPLDDRNNLQQTQETQRVFKNDEVGCTPLKSGDGGVGGGGGGDTGGGGGVLDLNVPSVAMGQLTMR